MPKIFLFLIFFLSFSVAQTEHFSPAERLQGYALRDDQLIFIFDESIYQVQADKVVVEGSMRGWDHDLEDRQWWLKRSEMEGLWLLRIENREFHRIPPGTFFKYRINQGEWMNPPAGAANERGGNLVLAPEIKALRLKAEIVGPRNVQLHFRGVRPEYIYSAARYHIQSYEGALIPIERVFYLEPGKLQLVPAQNLDIRRLYYLYTPYRDERVTITYDGWFRQLYSSKPLGANYSKEENATWIRLFVPRADSVQVFLYLQPGDSASAKIDMVMDSLGVWETRLQGNWEGWYYDFRAYGADEPGNHFYSALRKHFTDPWGRVSVDTFGPCRIWPSMQPATPLRKGIPRMEDVIAYEVHIQDFTRLLPIPEPYRGTFSGFVIPGLKNARGEAIGFDHLLELGINVVHLMPVQEYLHYPDEEWRAAFLNDPYMMEQGINAENYQWGYRTSHAFALESRYRVKGSEWGAQNEQFRDLVQAFHDHDIAVIVDLVFNHTAERMDNRQYYFNFSAMDVPYFYRTDDQLNFIGEYGTETKSEVRPIMQRWIIEQCTDLIQQYGIDGFRIDLAGQTDKQTLKALREELGPEIIVYGEPWIASADPDYEDNPDWDWYKADAPITFFQDDTRNAFTGPPSDPRDKRRDRGYAGGNGDRENVKKALSAGFPEDQTPLSGINYLDIHDNWALADRFAASDWDGRFGVDERSYKIAATLLFTSLGPIVLHGGSELMRSKGVAPLQELIKYTATGPIYIHGKRDTYNLARANAFLWENKGLNIGDGPDVHCNYKNMYDFWKGLIAFRKSDHGKVFRIAHKPDAHYYQWFEPPNPHLLGYLVDHAVLVLINTDTTSAVFESIQLPRGNWQLIANIDRIDHRRGIIEEPFTRLKGARRHTIPLEPEDLKIWIKK